MDWSKGYTSRYALYRVDPRTWADTEELRFTGGSIDRTDDDLLESADLDMTEAPAGVESWVRLYLEARQDGVPTRSALFTGLTSAPERKLDGHRESFHVECYSVLKSAEDILLEPGWYAPAGMAGAGLAGQLLSCGSAPVLWEGGSPALREYLVAERGETRLTMAEKILASIGWRLRIGGDGSIRIKPPTSAPVRSFGQENDVFELSVSDGQDWFSCPNCLRVVSGSVSATARDDDPASALSTARRGREVWAYEGSVTLADGESLGAYARRRLKELQAPARRIAYTRRFDPEVRVGDLVEVRYPGEGISGLFRITSQSVTLGHNGATKEEAVEV
ncbi:MAG: hypothetical protein IJ713_01355 [Oscillibacter sp.]|nr:hypothetical protein [Oscillibacter sp.]